MYNNHRHRKLMRSKGKAKHSEARRREFSDCCCAVTMLVQTHMNSKRKQKLNI